MIAAGKTFEVAARAGVGVNAFGLAATGALQLGNFQLEDTTPAPIQALANKL